MAKAQLVAAVIAAVALVPDAAGQRPVIQTGGIQNAGSFVASNPPSVSPQMLVTIRGENLAVSTEIANVIPLPTSLAGTSVTFNGTLAPLLYVSPVQINAQVPSALRSLVDLNGNVATVVTTPSGSSDPVTAYVDSQQFGIFTQGATGCGQAVAFNIHSDGRDITMNTPQNSFDPESDLGLAIFLTGDGFSPDRVDGVPWIFNPADNKISPSFYTLGILFGVPGMTGGWAPFTAQYEGPAPGMIGVDQVNGLGQWKGSPQGCRVPMYLVYFGYDASQVVNISIHPGGGKCVDPPESTLGMIAWQRTSISDVGGSNTQDAIMAQFIQTDGLGFPDSGTLTSAGSTTCCAPDAQPAYCDGSLPSTLDAGMLTFTGPGIDSLTVPGSTRNGRITYEAILPAGTLRGGDYQVIGSGGSQVGAFDSEAHIPDPITIKNNLAPGSRLFEGSSNELTLEWTGRDGMVTAQVVAPGFQMTVTENASAGSLKITQGFYLGPCLACVPVIVPSGDVELIVTQSPYLPYPNAPVQPFSAPGLGMGGEQTWKYVFDFRGLRN